ncbi:MAG TPA: EcsC family protein [Luteimonas sp.]
MTELTQNSIMQALDWAYEKAVGGVAGLDSASDIADSYSKNGGSKIDQANSLIRWQNAKAGTSGFLTGLGGILIMPVTIPANLASVMYVQIRMIAAIAHLGGHDLRDDRVKTLVYACLTGNAAKEILKDVGIQVGKKFAQSAIKNISGKTLQAINQKVGFRLLTKAGEKGVINLGKTVPLLGGIVGAAFDSVTTNTIGNIARDTFITADEAEVALM